MIHLVSLAHGARHRGLSDGYSLFYNANGNSSASSDLHRGSTNSEITENDGDISSEHVNYDALPQNMQVIHFLLVCVYLYIYMCVCVCVWALVRAYSLGIYLYMYACVHVRMYCTIVHIFVCMHVCMCVDNG